MTSNATRAAALAEREADAILRYFERRVEVREDAADLLGVTLLTLWRRSADIPIADESARMWLFGVARRVLATHRRGLRRYVALADRLRGELALAGGGDDATVERVRAAVRDLPEKDRELIGLTHWEGFGLSEAAEILGIRPSTARMRYQRARERLALSLADVEVERGARAQTSRSAT